jgi:hypothetical protein
VNSETQTAENLYYRDINPKDATPARRDQTHGLTEDTPSHINSSSQKEDDGRSGQPKYLFSTAGELNKICEETDLTIAQVVWENELAFRSSKEIKRSLMESKFIYPEFPIDSLRIGLSASEDADISVGDNGRMYSKRSNIYRNPSTRWFERQETSPTPISKITKRFLPHYRSWLPFA